MTLQMRNWRVDLSHILFLGFKGDSHAETFTLLTDFEEDFDLRLDVELEGQKNIIQLFKTADRTYSVTLTRDMTGANGIYKAQIRGTLGETVKHSNIFALCIGDSINAEKSFPPSLPSEFEQAENRIRELNNNPPKASDTGFWEIYDAETKQYVQSDIPLPNGGKPFIINITVLEDQPIEVPPGGPFDEAFPISTNGFHLEDAQALVEEGYLPVLFDGRNFSPMVSASEPQFQCSTLDYTVYIALAPRDYAAQSGDGMAAIKYTEIGGGGGTPQEVIARTIKSFNYTALNGEDGFSIGDDGTGSMIRWHPRDGFLLYRPSTVTYVGENTLPNLDMAARQAGNPLTKTILVPPNATNLELFVGIELFGTADLAADPTVWTAQSISADGTVGTQQAVVSALTDSLTVGDLSITAAEANRKISITNNSENYVLFTHMWPYSHFTKW